MSMKQVKRMQRLKGQQAQACSSSSSSASDNEGSSSGEGPGLQPVARRFNAFSLLGGDDDEVQEEEEEGEGQEEEEEKERGTGKCDGQSPTPLVTLPSSSLIVNTAAGVGGRGGRGGKGGRGGRGGRGRGSGKQKSSKQSEIDLLVASIEAPSSSSSAPTSATSYSTSFSSSSSPSSPTPSRGEQKKSERLFAVAIKHLNAENELRRLFGSETIDEALEEQRHPGGRNQRGFIHTTAVFVRPPAHLPPPGAFPSGRGVSMAAQFTDHAADEPLGFEIRWGADYRALQEQYLRCVASLDPQTLLQLLGSEPYHLDALLQTSLLLTQTGQNEEAVALIERGLVSFEHCWHASFRPSSGLCRLSYAANPEARPFFQLLFRHAQVLARKACCRTALEITKLLLQLDPSDPLHARLVLDYFAIRSKQHHYLLRFFTEYTGATLFLPNIYYGIALAQLFSSSSFSSTLQSSTSTPTTNSSSSSTSAPTYLSLENSASVRLQDALLAFPQMLAPLIQSAGYRTVDASHAHFSSPRFSSPALDNLVKLYLIRSGSLWKDPRIEPWVAANVARVVARVQEGDPQAEEALRRLQDTPELATSSGFAGLQECDYTDNVHALPRDIMQQAAVHHHQLAPPGPEVIHAPTDNPFWLFLHSLMPWNRMPNAPPQP